MMDSKKLHDALSLLKYTAKLEQFEAIATVQDAVRELQAERGGRVDSGLVSELLAEANRQANETADLLNRAAEALAQNAQGEAVAWMCETVNGYTAFSRDGKFPCNAGKISPLYLHAERARVPDGWGLKPSKATGDMVLAGIHENLSDPGPNVFNRIWAAMFAAAPSQPEDASHE